MIPPTDPSFRWHRTRIPFRASSSTWSSMSQQRASRHATRGARCVSRATCVFATSLIRRAQLRIKEYPYSAVVNYTAHATKFVIEYKTGSGLIDFQTLFTVEAADIEAVINEFVQQAVLKKMEGMELPRTIDDIVRKVVMELNKKQEKIDKKEIAETIESLIPMERASISRQELHNMIIEAINRALEKP